MRMLLLNCILAVGWALVVGDFGITMLLAGFALGYAALWMTRPLYGGTAYFERFWRFVRLIGLFLYELVVSSLRVVWDVVTPPLFTRPGIIALPLDARSDVEILLVANLISLTPGTLSLDVSPDRRTLFVHAMFIDDAQAVKDELKAGMERRVLEALR